MKITCKLLLSFIFTLLFAFFLNTNIAYASEGTVELRSTTSASYKCYASSIQMKDLNYTVLVTCRDLLYPAGEDIFNYVLWANPTDGGKPFRLGTLGLGRVATKTKKTFSSLFVTTEADGKAKSPSGTTVMRGDLTKIKFLEGPLTPAEEEKEEVEEISEETLTPTPSTRSRLVAGLKRAALVSLFALAALIGLVFILTRKR
jgi:hypothetical protein